MSKARRRPTLRQAERAIGEPAFKWKARCFEIASKLVDKGLVDGVAVYGHWLGEVHPRSGFARVAVGFVQHGWVVLNSPEGYVCDPTRWCFEGEDPYIFWGKNGGEYDEGGNQFREGARGGPPEFDPDDRQFEITKSVMGSVTWTWVERFLDIRYDSEQPVGVLTNRQLAYLANTSPQRLGEHAGPVYDALVKLGREGLIPIDNKRSIERMQGRR